LTNPSIRFSKPEHDEVTDYFSIKLFVNGVDVAEVHFEKTGMQAWYIGYLEVNSHYQKMGYGALLIKHLENLARHEHVLSIQLSAFKTASGFWRKMGYYVQGWNSPTDYAMSKDLRFEE